MRQKGLSKRQHIRLILLHIWNVLLYSSEIIYLGLILNLTLLDMVPSERGLRTAMGIWGIFMFIGTIYTIKVSHKLIESVWEELEQGATHLHNFEPKDVK
jgi:hypothetical protein